MYDGIVSILRLMNHYCDNQEGCDYRCSVFKECKTENWDLLKEDLKKLGIKEEDVGLP